MVGVGVVGEALLEKQRRLQRADACVDLCARLGRIDGLVLREQLVLDGE